MKNDSPWTSDPDPMRLEPEIAENWSHWSVVIGTAALQRLERLQSGFEQMTAAVLGSADGLHVCSLGLDEDDAWHLAAMNSSLFGVARAESEVLSGGTEVALHTIVTMTIGSTQTAVLGMAAAPFGQLLLAISARDVHLGRLLLEARTAATDIVEIFRSTPITR